MNYLIKVLHFIFIGLITSSVNAQKNDNSISSQAKSIIEAVIEEQGLVGTQAAIWYNGEWILNQSWGYANMALSTPVNEKTKFFIASITKNLTGLTILKLANEGKINLDIPISTYLKNFPKNPGSQITSRLLIQHRSGIRHYRRGELANSHFFDTNYVTATDAMQKFMNDTLIASPGSRERYSSFGYAVLASIIEEVTGDSFAEYQRKTIFEPLEMNNTEVPDWRYAVEELATSYGYFLPHLGSSSDEEPFEARRLNFSYNPGGGNLVSTSKDLVKYGRNLIKDRVVLDKILDTSEEPRTTFGWSVSTDHSERTVLHATGASEAYQAGLTIWPDHNLIVVALTNTWGKGSRSGGFTLSMHRDIAEVVIK